MFTRKLVIAVSVVILLFGTFAVVDAGCRGGSCGRGFFGGRAPVRSFFRNRQPVRRVIRGAARVATAPVRGVVVRRQAIRAYRSQRGRVVAVPSVPNQPVTHLGPAVQPEQIVSNDYPVYDSVSETEFGVPYTQSYFNSYAPQPQYRTCGPYGCN